MLHGIRTGTDGRNSGDGRGRERAKTAKGTAAEKGANSWARRRRRSMELAGRQSLALASHLPFHLDGYWVPTLVAGALSLSPHVPGALVRPHGAFLGHAHSPAAVAADGGASGRAASTGHSPTRRVP